MLTEADFAEEVDSNGEDSNTEETQRVLRFCPNDPSTAHAMEATCIICFKDYEEGENVVWSSGEGCCHVFHRECMLKWISTGKKRCPICRNLFVPDTPMEDLKQLLERGEVYHPPPPEHAEVDLGDTATVGADAV